MRVRVASDGDPRARSTWSGIPSRLIAAMERQGVEVDAIDVASAVPGEGLPWHLDRLRVVPGVLRTRGWRGLRYHSYNAALASPRIPRGRMGRHLELTARLPPASVLIQTSGFVNPDGMPTVVLTDMTFRQAVRHNWKGFGSGPPSWRRAGEMHDRQVFSGAVACCAASSWAARSIIDDYGVSGDKVRVVGLGAEPSRLTGERDWSTPRFLFVGLDWFRKNGPLLLQCFSRLRIEFPDAELHVVGDHPRIDLAGVYGHGVLRWESSAGECGLSELLARVTCLVLPSAVEPFGLVHVEAGAAGIPSIGTTVGGAADAVGPGGILVKPGDPCGLLTAMRRMAEADEAECMGAAARRHAEGLTWDRVAERVLAAARSSATRS